MTVDDTTPRNRTGIAMAEDRAVQMVEAVEEFPATSQGSGAALAAVRVRYAREGSERQASAAVEETPLLMDKLGERLAFERVGTRLYEALLSKFDAFGPFDGGPSREDIAHILGEELQHFRMLAEAIQRLGGDPTELTPSANLQLTASQGVGHVLVDPRTNLIQSLEAIAVAELADNECWEALAGLSHLAGHEDLAEQCEAALLTEQEHLEKVRAWLAAGQGRPEVEGEGSEGGVVEDQSTSRGGGPKKARRRR